MPSPLTVVGGGIAGLACAGAVPMAHSTPGFALGHLEHPNRIGACGDGWAAPSHVEAAWTSGDALGRARAGRG